MMDTVVTSLFVDSPNDDAFLFAFGVLTGARDEIVLVPSLENERSAFCHFAPFRW